MFDATESALWRRASADVVSHAILCGVERALISSATPFSDYIYAADSGTALLAVTNDNIDLGLLIKFPAVKGL